MGQLVSYFLNLTQRLFGPYEKFVDENPDFLKEAENYIKSGNWEDAGLALFKAADLAIDDDQPSYTTADRYIDSAECYRKILSAGACESYRKSIEAYVEKGDIGPAILQSIKCGYIYEKQYDDIDKSNEFYDMADHLRRTHNQEHSCSFPEFSNEDFAAEIANTFYKDDDIITNTVNIVICILSNKIICSTCAYFRSLNLEYDDECVKIFCSAEQGRLHVGIMMLEHEIVFLIEYVEMLNPTERSFRIWECVNRSGESW